MYNFEKYYLNNLFGVLDNLKSIMQKLFHYQKISSNIGLKVFKKNKSNYI